MVNSVVRHALCSWLGGFESCLIIEFWERTFFASMTKLVRARGAALFTPLWMDFGRKSSKCLLLLRQGLHFRSGFNMAMKHSSSILLNLILFHGEADKSGKVQVFYVT